MSKLNVSGTVVYMPGTWGPARPVPNATIELIDLDPPGAGSGDDTIYRGQTNAAGWFQGTTGDWQDTVSKQVWVPGTLIPPTGHWTTVTGPDLTDLLALQIHVTEQRSDGQKDYRGAYLAPPVNAAAPVVVVPWGPPPPAQPVPIVIVNGQGFTDANGAVAACKAGLDSHQRLLVGFVDPQVVAMLLPLGSATLDQLRVLIAQRLGVPGLTLSNITPDVILAIAALVAAIGTAVAVAAIGTAIGIGTVVLVFAVVYALYQGYRHVHVVLKTNSSTGATEIEFQFDQ